MNITSRQLKAFLLTARHQNFSRAAEQLCITQSGMSVLVRELEEQLGFRLFDRTTRKVTLTEFGTRFLPIADRSMLDLESAAANIGRSAAAASGRLAIGATPLIAGRLLPAAIGAYAKRDPGLHITLYDGERSQLVSMVASGELDVAYGWFLGVPGLTRIPLYRFALMLVEPAAQAGGPAGELRWADIGGRTLLGAPADNPIQQLVDRTLERFGRRSPPKMVLNYFETQIAMTAAGAGCAIVPTFAIPACRHLKVAMHLLIDPVVPLDLFQVGSRGHRLPPATDGFSAFLKDYIAEWAEPWSRELRRAA
jgi:LysR family transcriptional regulator, carnitine catabolism transcriptional activator